MTSRELTSGFDFWSRGHLRMVVMHLPVKFGADFFIQSGVIDIFPKFKMTAAAILDFGKMSITPDWIKISASNFTGLCTGHWLIQQLVLQYKPCSRLVL